MNVSELKALQAAGNVLVLDVREPDEIAADSGIPGSTAMPMGKAFVEAGKGGLPKDKKIVTVCKSGYRCEIVARELKEKGFDIDHLEGGLAAWKANEE